MENLRQRFFVAAFSLTATSLGVLAQDADNAVPGALETTVVESTPAPAPAPAPPRPAPRVVAPAPLPTPVIVDQVVETPTRTEELIEDVPASIGVITEEDIAEIAPLSFDDLTLREPNVEFFGGPRYLGEQLVIRGEGGSAVTVRLDDARQNFVSGHSGQRFFIETDFLREVEILRGAGSFLYGSGSAGVVNLSTLDPTDVVKDGNALGLRIRNTYHSNTQEWANSVVGAAVGETVQILIGGSDRKGNDINQADGVDLAASSIDRQSSIGKIIFTPTDEVEFGFGFIDYQSNDRGGANPQSLAVGTTGNDIVDRQIDFSQFTADFRWNPVANDLIDIDATFYYNTTRQVRDYTGIGTTSNLNRQNIHDLDVYGIDISNRSVITFGNLEHEFVYGIDFYTEDQDGTETRNTFFTPGSPGNSSGRPDAEADNFGIYLTDQIELNESLTLFAGLRYDTYDSTKTAGAPSQQSDGALSPHVGFSLDLTEKISVFGQYSRGFTAPTLNDLYIDGSHFGVVPNDPFFETIRAPFAGFSPGPVPPAPGQINVNYFEEVFVPNPNLLPEESDNFELGVHYEDEDFAGGRFSARLTGFYKAGENTFDSDIVGGRFITPFNGGFATPPNVPSALSPVFFGPPVGPPAGFAGFSGINFTGTLQQAFRQTVNREETEIYGFEFEADYDADFWFANLALGAVRGEDTTTGQQLNTIGGDQLSVTLGLRPINALEFGIYGIWNGGREDLVSSTFNQTSAYDIYGAFFAFQVNEAWQIRGGIDNAFDQAYERTSPLLQEPGRNLFITSTLHF